jgi:hypothetical protein
MFQWAQVDQAAQAAMTPATALRWRRVVAAAM